MYILEGRYLNIEDTNVKSLWCFESKDDVEYYIYRLENFISDCSERYVKYLNKHKPEEDGEYNDYELNRYIAKVARLLWKKDIEQNFWLEALFSLNYYDYEPTFRCKEIEVKKFV